MLKLLMDNWSAFIIFKLMGQNSKILVKAKNFEQGLCTGPVTTNDKE